LKATHPWFATNEERVI